MKMTSNIYFITAFIKQKKFKIHIVFKIKPSWRYFFKICLESSRKKVYMLNREKHFPPNSKKPILFLNKHMDHSICSACLVPLFIYHQFVTVFKQVSFCFKQSSEHYQTDLNDIYSYTFTSVLKEYWIAKNSIFAIDINFRSY